MLLVTTHSPERPPRTFDHPVLLAAYSLVRPKIDDDAVHETFLSLDVERALTVR